MCDTGIDTSYALTPNKKRRDFSGIGLVIVNIFENYPALERKGAKEELTLLSKLFASFNLEVRRHTELTKDKIVKVLKETAKDPKLSSDSMIAVAISSHGCVEGLLGININNRLRNDPNYKNMEDCIPPTQILEIFNGNNCAGLAGKPKLFLLNGCRGYGIEDLVLMEDEPLTVDDPDNEELIATTWSDFFVVHSCVPGHVSMRSSTQGSLFFIEFSKSYAKYGAKYSIQRIMPTINRNLIIVCVDIDAKSKQSCTWDSTCTRSLRIPPTDAVFESDTYTVTTHSLPALKPPLRDPTHFSEVRNLGTKFPHHIPVSGNPISPSIEQVQGLIQPFDGEQAYTKPYPIQQDFHNPIPYSSALALSKPKPSPMSSLNGLVVGKYGEIYVTDPTNECIWVIINEVNSKVLDKAWNRFSYPNKLAGLHGISIKDQFLFVTCSSGILKFSCLSGELLQSKLVHTSLTGLDIDDLGLIYVCEQFSCKILVLDTDFNFPRDKLKLSGINTKKDRLLDIKVFPNEIYVLISGTAFCIHKFDEKGGILIVNIVSGQLLGEIIFFTMNRSNKNIFVGDSTTVELKAFSNEGDFLWKEKAFGEYQDESGCITGIDMNYNNEVVIACICNSKCMIRKFPSLNV